MNNSTGHIDEKLLMRYLLGEADDQEKVQVEDWLKLSVENQKQLDKLESVWAEAGKLTPHPVAVDVRWAWAKMSDRVDQYEEEIRAPKTKVRKLQTKMIKYASIAAMFVIVFAITQLINKSDFFTRDVTLASIDEVLKDSLPDGSKIALNTNSKLVYAKKFVADVRKVQLEGEAYFDVEPDPELPFIVQAGNAHVRVLGTQFNVKAYPDEDVEVTVTEGLVQLFKVDDTTGDTLSVFLSAGEKGILPEESNEPEVLDEPDPDDLYWMSHTFDFKETELEKVFDLLKQYYDVEIAVSDSAIYNCRLSTSFTDGTIIEILDVIAFTFELELKQNENTFTLEGDGCINDPKQD